MKQQKSSNWISFISIVCILIGFYALARLTFNLVAYPAYPMTGVIPFFQTNQYVQQERDCQYPPMTYYNTDGNMRKATAEEMQFETQQRQMCLDTVRDARILAKTNDINFSLFFLFIGIGIVVTKKFFLK